MKAGGQSGIAATHPILTILVLDSCSHQSINFDAEEEQIGSLAGKKLPVHHRSSGGQFIHAVEHKGTGTYV